jgi:hypothetical protein
MKVKGGTMTVQQALEQVQFIVDAEGKATAAIVEIGTWQMLLDLLAQAEDQGLLRDYLARRRNANSPDELGLIAWHQAEAELDQQDRHDDAPLD